MAGREAPALTLGHVERRDGDDVIEGMLLCPDKACQREYPIIDGIPLLVLDIRGVVAGQLSELRARDDLSAFSESWLGDCAGPDSELVTTRYHLSTYARSHYGDFDPAGPALEAGLPQLLARGLELLPEPPAGAWLDVGCSVGRGSFELAARTGDLVLGVDMNIAMLKLARRVLTRGRAVHPHRRVGMVYEQRDYPVELPATDRVDFWACDATGLAFGDGTVDGALSLNVVDCIASPMAHVVELGRVLRPGARALFATPYDWSTGATPVEQWLGGHSQRGPDQGSSAAAFRRLLSPESGVTPDPQLQLTAEADQVPWHVYVHERATMYYQAHLLVGTRRDG